jgi:hypothetical protein
MAEVYRLFGGDSSQVDYSEEAAQEMYRFETYGEGTLKQGLFSDPTRTPNGYAVGKHWSDAQVKTWIEDLYRGHLRVVELYEPYPGEMSFPHWWLDRVLPAGFVQLYRQLRPISPLDNSSADSV